MFKKLSVTISFIAMLLVSNGCMTAVPFQPAEVQADKALLYIYRPESMISRGKQFSIVINDERTVSPLVNNGYIPVYVEPGSVKLVLQENTIPKGTLDTKVFNDLTAGSVMYIKADPAVFGAYKLIKMDETTGRVELSKTSLYQAK